MKIKNKDIDAVVGTGALSVINSITSFDVELIFKLVELSEILKVPIGVFGKAVKALREKYAAPNINDQDGYNGEIVKLLDMEVDIPFEKLSIKKADVPKGSLSASHILALRPFIEFVEKPKEEKRPAPEEG